MPSSLELSSPTISSDHTLPHNTAPYSHPTVKRTPLPLARVLVFLWIPPDSLQNVEEMPRIFGAVLWVPESVVLYALSLDSKVAVEGIGEKRTEREERRGRRETRAETR